MDCFTFFKENHIEDSGQYPHNDISMARLFYDLHSKEICYVREARSWYAYDGRRWVKDDGSLSVMELCKHFAQDFARYAELMNDDSDEGRAFARYAAEFHTRRRREGLLSDARSIAPKTLAHFDRDKMLFNCCNGTFSLNDMVLRPHKPEDCITKLARAAYNKDAACERWERFIGEVMCGDADTAQFLQKALGCCLSGDTSLECFFILYGSTTRNGKSTLMETTAYILGDYARTIQPQTLVRRPADGSAASPDIARLKGARLVSTPEPEKSMDLNIALVKQLTGGDTYTARHLHENPVEFTPEFKLFINTNHLPQASDATIFRSGRVMLIPFDRRFEPEEQDTGLKKFFRRRSSMSGILNFLIQGCKMLKQDGLIVPERVKAAIESYSREQDYMSVFFDETIIPAQENRLKTSVLHELYTAWAKTNGYKPLSSKEFMEVLRGRFFVKADHKKGNCVWGYDLKRSE